MNAKHLGPQSKDMNMGLTYTELKLTNVLNGKNIEVRTLVDTGATHMYITEEMALQLGFDPEEMPTRKVTLANGHHVTVPIIGPIKIAFANRTYMTEAMVLGDEPLMGVLPLEAMDLIVDPRQQQLIVNPAHPDFPVFYAKGAAQSDRSKTMM